MRNPRHAVFLLGTATLLAACSTPPAPQKPVEVVEKPVEPVPPPPPICTIQAKDAPIDELDIPGGKLANRSMYFDYDSYVIREGDKAVVQNHAAYLGKNQRTILIQGNTDERGGSEYNLALGQKRAEAVRKSLAALGVPDARMEAVSLGKEVPTAEGHDEEAWAQNRRADIDYNAK